MSIKFQKASTNVQHLFSSSEAANLLLKTTLTYVDGLEVEGISVFQVPLAASENVIKKAIRDAKDDALSKAEKLNDKLRDYLHE